jgi:hypothetical protein
MTSSEDAPHKRLWGHPSLPFQDLYPDIALGVIRKFSLTNIFVKYTC